jgi:hypothetical protein
MNHGPTKEFPRVPSLVRKYQSNWEVCLVAKTCSYHWLEMSPFREFYGNVSRQFSE